MAGSDESDAPGPSTKKKLRMEAKCVKTYAWQGLEAIETRFTPNESQRLNRLAKTSSERSREFRARKAQLKQQSKQQQQPDSIDEISTEDYQIAGPSPMNIIERRTKSAEATRKWREKKRGVNALLKKQAKTASQRMREYRERKKLTMKILLKQQSEQHNLDSIDNASIKKEEKNMNIGSDNQSPNDEEITSNMDIVLRQTREVDGGQSSIGDVVVAADCDLEGGTKTIMKSDAVELEDGDISGSCTWSSLEPSEGSFSISTIEGRFNNRTINEKALQSPDESVVVKTEPIQDSWPLSEATRSNFVVNNRDYESLNHKTQYCNQSIKTDSVRDTSQTLSDVKVERDEHLIFGEYIADRFRKCKRNDKEVNVAKNRIERIMFDLSAGALSNISSVGKNEIDQADEACSLLTSAIRPFVSL